MEDGDAYSIEDERMKTVKRDPRRWAGDNRMHPLIGETIVICACALSIRWPGFPFTNAEYVRAAVECLSEAGYILLLKVGDDLPKHLNERCRKLIKRHPTIPVWVADYTRWPIGSSEVIDVCLESSAKEIRSAIIRNRSGPTKRPGH
jgi:hypothetical protein